LKLGTNLDSFPDMRKYVQGLYSRTGEATADRSKVRREMRGGILRLLVFGLFVFQAASAGIITSAHVVGLDGDQTAGG
jgi:hypothetical protein